MSISVIIPTCSRPRAVEACIDFLGRKLSRNSVQASRLDEPGVEASSAESKPDLNHGNRLGDFAAALLSLFIAPTA